MERSVSLSDKFLHIQQQKSIKVSSSVKFVSDFMSFSVNVIIVICYKFLMKILLTLFVLLFIVNNAFAKCYQPRDCLFLNDELLTKEFCEGSKKFSDGSVYNGEFKNGVFDGLGTLHYANGDKYIGTFSNGKRHSGGTLYKSNGEKYAGVWKSDEFIIGKHNKEYYPKDKKIISKDGINYILESGTYENGKGIIFYSNGDVYVGEFKKGHRDGHGHYFFSEGRGWMESCMPLDGPWEQGHWAGPIV